MPRSHLAVAPLLSLLPACFLPLGTAAPQSATTVGDGGFGASYHVQAPTIELLGLDPDTRPDGEDGGDDEIEGAASAHAAVQLGINERLDLELQVEAAALLFFFPIPTGGSLGVRYRLHDGDWLDVATAGRAGFLTADPEGAPQRVYALFGQASLVAQLARGPVRPLLAVSATPADVFSSDADGSLDVTAALAWGATGGVTLVFGRVQATPYVAVEQFDSSKTERTESVSVGLSLSIRYSSDELKAMFPPPPPGTFLP